MRLKVITAHELYAVLEAIGAPATVCLRDPVIGMRYTASADLEALRRALEAVTVNPPDLSEMDEDEARLLVTGVVARVLVLARRMKRDRFVDEVQSVPM